MSQSGETLKCWTGGVETLALSFKDWKEKVPLGVLGFWERFVVFGGGFER